MFIGVRLPRRDLMKSEDLNMCQTPQIEIGKELITRIVERGGAGFLGLEAGFVWFTDPQTRSTLMLAICDCSAPAVRKKLAESRLKFRVAS